MPRVSVIVPNYNHAPYLRQRLDSIFNQTFQDFEVIILDDCSTDNSLEVLEECRPHPKVTHFVVNEANSGSTFKQWQKGVQLAKGEFVWIAESDDWCEPTFLQELMGGLAASSSTVMAYCATTVVGPNDRILRYGGVGQKLQQVFDGKEFVSRYLTRSNSIVNVSMMVFRRSAYLNIPTNLNELLFCGDWLRYMHMALQGDVFQSGKHLSYFRKHSADVTGRSVSQGLYYTEFITVVHTLRNLGIIDDRGFQGLLLERALMFISDGRVAPVCKNGVWNAMWAELSLQSRFRFMFFTRPKHFLLRVFGFNTPQA